MSEQEMQMKLASQQEKIKALRQEVAEMNKEREFWKHYRIQAAIAAMQGMIISDAYADTKIVNNMTYETSRTKWDNIKIAKAAVAHADALIEELKKGWEDD